MKRSLLILIIPAVALIGTSFSHAPRQVKAAESGKAHYDILWSWLQGKQYTKWNGVDGAPVDFSEGQSPHGALVKVYLSPRTAGNLKDLADGSVVVKENYSPDRKLMAITVMHRSKGYDAANGDWYYAKFMPDGKIATTPPEKKSMPIAGKFKSCIECHSAADGDDFAFFND